MTNETLIAALSDRYRIERELGAGGMATVYLAEDLKHGRQVAIKVLHPDLGAALGGERFLAEIRTTAKLQHPHILPLLDSGDAGNGLLYYVMPFVRGETLRARLEREQQLPIADAVQIAREVADALTHAHGQGIVHRDIKPENILLQDGHALVADFGIALAVQSAGGQRLTQTGLSLGTPQYMSPEQAMGERVVDARSDVYALGAVTYEMLAGEAPFTGPNIQAIVARLLAEEARPITATRKTVPPQVDAAVRQALAKLPADRFATASGFAQAIADTSRGEVARIPSNSGRSWRWLWPVVTLASVAAAIAAWVVPKGPSDGRDYSLQLQRQLTFEGKARGAALSSDGKWLAYVTTPCVVVTGCPATLMVREVDGTQSIKVASWPSIGTDIRWAPDGSMILLKGTNPDGVSGLFLVSRLGGATRRLGEEVNCMAFTPRGDSVVVIAGRGAGKEIFSISVESSGRSAGKLLPPNTNFFEFDLSPDGDRVVATYARIASGGVALLSREGALLDTLPGTYRPRVRWVTTGDAVYAERVTRGIGDDLVSIPVHGTSFARSTPQLMLGGIPSISTGYFDLTVGRTIVVSTLIRFDFLVAKLDDAKTVWRSPIQHTGYLEPADFSADGEWLLATATDNLADNLYEFNIDDGTERSVVALPGVGRQIARWSPDFKRLLYVRIIGDAASVVQIPRSGGVERSLSTVYSLAPVYYMANDEVMLMQAGALVTFDTTGKTRRRIPIPDSLAAESGEGFWSGAATADPVRRQFAYSGVGRTTIVVADLSTSEPRFSVALRSEHAIQPMRWGATGELYYREDDPRATPPLSRLMRLKRDGTTEKVIDLPAACDNFLVVSGSGTRVACRTVQNSPDVWLAEPARP